MVGRALASIPLCLVLATLGHGQSFANSSFETPDLATNTWMYNPAGSGWTFVGDAGIGDGTSVGSGAHTGNQYGLIRDQGAPCSIAQTVTGFVPGKQYRVKYWITKWKGTNGLHTGLTWDGGAPNLVDQFRITSTRWIQMASRWFTATQTSYTFTFRTRGNNDQHGTLVDDFEIEEGSPVSPLGLLNGGAEQPTLNDFESMQSPTQAVGIGWTFSANSSLTSGPAGPDQERAPQGNQFLDLPRRESVSQPIADLVPSLLYYVAFASRPSDADRTAGDMSVMLDSSLLWRRNGLTDTHWKYYGSPPWQAPNSSGVFKITAEYDYPSLSRLIDDVWYARCEPVAMSTFTLLKGQLVSGSVDDLRITDGTSVVIGGTPALTRAGKVIQFECKYHVPFAQTRYLHFNHTARLSRDFYAIDYELWDYSQSKWVAAARERYTTSFVTFDFQKVKVASPYVDPQTGEARLRGTLSGAITTGPNPPTTLYLDSILLWSEVP